MVGSRNVRSACVKRRQCQSKPDRPAGKENGNPSKNKMQRKILSDSGYVEGSELSCSGDADAYSFEVSPQPHAKKNKKNTTSKKSVSIKGKKSALESHAGCQPKDIASPMAKPLGSQARVTIRGDEADQDIPSAPILNYSRENRRLRFSLLPKIFPAATDASTPADESGRCNRRNVNQALDSSHADFISPVVSPALKCTVALGASLSSGYESIECEDVLIKPADRLPLFIVSGDNKGKADDCVEQELPIASNSPSKRQRKLTQRARLREWEDKRNAELEEIEQLELFVE